MQTNEERREIAEKVRNARTTKKKQCFKTICISVKVEEGY